jgi:hypothetical protein
VGNTSSGNSMAYLITFLYMGGILGPEEVNYSCSKVTHTGTVVRDFTVLMKPVCEDL